MSPRLTCLRGSGVSGSPAARAPVSPGLRKPGLQSSRVPGTPCLRQPCLQGCRAPMSLSRAWLGSALRHVHRLNSTIREGLNLDEKVLLASCSQSVHRPANLRRLLSFWGIRATRGVLAVQNYPRRCRHAGFSQKRRGGNMDKKRPDIDGAPRGGARVLEARRL